MTAILPALRLGRSSRGEKHAVADAPAHRPGIPTCRDRLLTRPRSRGGTLSSSGEERGMDAPCDGDRSEPRFAWGQVPRSADPRAREHPSPPQRQLPLPSPRYPIACPHRWRGEGQGEGPGSWEAAASRLARSEPRALGTLGLFLLPFVLALLEADATESSIGQSLAPAAATVPGPEFVWTRKPDSPATRESGGLTVAADPEGNVYWGGFFADPTITFGDFTLVNRGLEGTTEFCLVKCNSRGQVLWADSGGGSIDDEVSGLALAPSGGCYAAVSSGMQDGNRLRSYGAGGGLLWSQVISTTGGLRVSGMAADGEGNAYLTGYFIGVATFGWISITNVGGYDIFLARYDAGGNPVWARTVGGTQDDMGHAICVGAGGDVYVTGEYRSLTLNFGIANLDPIILTNSSPTGSTELFLARFTSQGEVQWARDGKGPGFGIGTGVVLDRFGHCYLAGYFAGTISLGTTSLTSSGYGDLLVARFDPEGNLLWVRQSGGEDREVSSSIAVDTLGSALVSGRFSGTAAFGPFNLTSRGDSDAFLARYTTSGSPLWAIQVGGTNFDSAYGMALDPFDYLFLTGSFSGSATFGNTNLVNPDLNEMYLSRIRPGSLVPPSIVVPPQSQTAVVGDTATFTVVTSGTLPMGYRWRKGPLTVTNMVLNSHTSVYRIFNVQETDAGNYTVVITNAASFTPGILSSAARLTVVPGVYSLTVQVAGAGSVQREPDLPAYDPGREVVLTALPGCGAVFSGWSGDLLGSDNPSTILLTTNKTVTANFEPADPMETLNYNGVTRTAPVGMPALFVDGEFVVTGAVTRVDRAEISMLTTFSNGQIYYTLDGAAPSLASTPYSGAFALRRSATLRAVANETACGRLVEADPIEVEVVYSFPLRLKAAGGGQVIAAPAQERYLAGTVVDLTARAEPGWSFLGWLGDLSGNVPAGQLLIEHETCVEALFGTALQTTVTGAGSLQREPEVVVYPSGSMVRLTAVAEPSHYFVQWGGAANTSNNPLRLAITQSNQTVSCLFEPLPAGQHALTVIEEGAGQVLRTPDLTRYEVGALVSLLATPEPGEEFLGWGGDASGLEAGLSVVMDRSKVVTARFTARPRWEIPACHLLVDQGMLRLVLIGEVGAVYQIEVAARLEGPNTTWLPWAFLTNTLGRTQFNDSLTAAPGPRFYRAVLLGPGHRVSP